MANKVSLEIDENFLKKFFALTDRQLPDNEEVTMAIMRRQLEEIENTIADLKIAAKEASKPTYTPASSPKPASQNTVTETNANGDTFNLPKKTILVIDDLGVITYQLDVLFSQMNYNVVTSQEIYDAIDKFKKQLFDMVVMDLYIPTEREGLILLEELKKLSSNSQKPSRIGVMSASTKIEHKQLCKMKGAEFYVEKTGDWQKELCRVVSSIK
ncbi:MAG: response regulator [bacterium]|nr:response regulator [bacterium]